MVALWVFIGLFAVTGIILFIKGIKRIWRRKPISGSLRGLTGLVFLSLAALAFSIVLNLYTYQRFNEELLVAEVRYEKQAEQEFMAFVMIPGKPEATFLLRGDEWEISARMLKWHGMAHLVGMDPLYRLDRIEGKYRDTELEINGNRTVYDLSDSQGLDLFAIANSNSEWVPWIDAQYGDANYTPMKHGARYKVTMSMTGLVTRAVNPEAEDATRNWK